MSIQQLFLTALQNLEDVFLCAAGWTLVTLLLVLLYQNRYTTQNTNKVKDKII